MQLALAGGKHAPPPEIVNVPYPIPLGIAEIMGVIVSGSMTQRIEMSPGARSDPGLMAIIPTGITRNGRQRFIDGINRSKTRMIQLDVGLGFFLTTWLTTDLANGLEVKGAEDQSHKRDAQRNDNERPQTAS